MQNNIKYGIEPKTYTVAKLPIFTRLCIQTSTLSNMTFI